MAGRGPHRRILALHTAAVETHGGHALLPPLHADHALVVLLARLGLRQVLSPQGKRLHDADWDQEVPSRQDLGAALRGRTPSATHRPRMSRPSWASPASRRLQGTDEMRPKTEKPEASPCGAQSPRARLPPHLRAVDPALLEGALVGVAGTHVAVLTPVAGVRAADAGHAPGGEKLQKQQRRPGPPPSALRLWDTWGTKGRRRQDPSKVCAT